MNARFLNEFSNGRDNNLNLIRMIAAIGVLISHAWAVSSGLADEQPFSDTLKGIDLGTISVYVFFAISGYLVAQSFERSSSFKRFWSARILRIFPGLLVVILITALVLGPLFTVAAAEEFWPAIPAYIVRNFTLFSLQQYLPGVFTGNPVGRAINVPLWTLNYELLCYISVSLMGLAGVLKSPRLMTVALTAFVVAYAVVLYFEPHHRLTSLAKLALPFMTGVSFFVWRTKIPLHPLIGVGLVLIAALTYDTILFREAFVLCLTYIVFLLAYLPGGKIRLYNRLGDYSYGIYIYAFPIQQIVASQGVDDPYQNILFSLPIALIFAVLSWMLIERPSLAFSKMIK